ncbi:Carboxypeptidase A4 [Armadillidium vulgare]|nr:Carboxypeptidase A4 [Armadillidium vulgare]
MLGALHSTRFYEWTFEERRRKIVVKELRLFLDDYNSLEDIESYLQNVSATSDYATLRSIGKSVEGRDLWQLKISVGSGKSSLWIDCNVHAREWISGATCLYGINLLIGSYGSDADVTAFLDAYDVYFIPINNPDGYKFTWDEDRMWRKNRNKYPDTLCYGIDLNRNFDNHFGEAGSSDVPCAETYEGPSPASEPETQANQDAILELIDTADLKILISVHSYSQLWMYPFGYTDELPPNNDELNRLTEIGVNALEAVYGTHYDYGPIDPASGSSVDFAYDNGVVIGFAMELRDTGEYGFLLPADQIAPTGKETWAGIIASALAA